MNKIVLISTLALVLLSGCWPSLQTAPPHGTFYRPDKELKPAVMPPRSAAPVTASQITPDNAHKVSQALWDEIDREAQQEPPSPMAPASSPCKH